jgi:hypothetical protein
MIDFASAAKGGATEALLASLLREAGYSVIPTAIEGLVPALSAMDQDAYQRLSLSPELRLLPDLLVLPCDGAALQVEVKFRSRIDREVLRQLLERLRRQQAVHPATQTVLVRGVSPRGEAARVDDLIRVLPPGRLALLEAADLFWHTCVTEGDEEERIEPVWGALRPLTTSFPRLQSHRNQLERLIPLIRSLADQ